MIIVTSCITIILVLVSSNMLVTFVHFRDSIQKAVNDQIWLLNTQIVYNYENYINSIIRLSNTIQTDIDRYNFYSQYGPFIFSAYLAETVKQKDDVIKIAVYSYNDSGRCLASSNVEEVGEVSDNMNQAWFTEAINEPSIHVFSTPYYDDETGIKVNISKLINLQKGNKRAVLKIEHSFQNMIDIIEISNLGETGHITIVDQDYGLVYTSLEHGIDDEVTDVIRDIILGSKGVVINGHHMSVNVYTLANTKWRICVFINLDNINEIQNVFLSVIVLVSLVVAAAGILLFLSVAHMITNPLKKLELAMLKVEKSDYFQMEEVNLEASKEVMAMTRQFNKMMLKISELMKRVVKEQGAQRMSELKALQSQINPHFLYNTLESILWLVENKKNAEAGEMVVALARLFRISISKESETISLRDEIEHVRNYLLIQSIRYPESFDYEFEVDESLLDCQTMKLVLQPMVENSIYHGLKNKIDKGKIRITAQREDSFLVLSVSDNGYGIKQETIDRLFASFEYGAVSDSVGLKNIYQRIMIYFGGKAEMLIESELDEGTVITIKEPLSKP